VEERVPTRENEAVDCPATADRLNVALIAEAAEALGKLQARTRMKKVDIANRALTLYEFVEAELRAGNELVIEAPNGTKQRVKIL
jgi:hypothetical protein